MYMHLTCTCVFLKNRDHKGVTRWLQLRLPMMGSCLASASSSHDSMCRRRCHLLGVHRR